MQNNRFNACVDVRSQYRTTILFFSSLEDCLAAQDCAGVEVLRQDLEKTAIRFYCAEASEAHLRAELACLKER